jgi:zinc and cadmium transporter
MQFAVSFVAGVMLGVGVLHMLPHAVAEAAAASDFQRSNSLAAVMLWLLAGILIMFFMERFFCFHHHDVPNEQGAGSREHGVECSRADDEEDLHDVRVIDYAAQSFHPASSIQNPASHHHDLSWSGAALGLALHSILNGVALAAAVLHGNHGAGLAGFGTFLVIFLHKPFDAMTIGMLMAHGGWSITWRLTVNALFALAIPLGVAIFLLGLMPASTGDLTIAYALAFSAGTFLCISLSDLLPELQFHQHDRAKLSAALLLGLAVAYAAGRLEAAVDDAHSHTVTARTSLTPYRPCLTVAGRLSVQFVRPDARC